MKSFVFAALIAFATTAFAEAPLMCSVNKSESFAIYTTSQKVVHGVFMQSETTLDLESFEVFKCPGCYAFKGTANGKTYAGTTTGKLTPNGIEYTFNHEVDGVVQPETFCFEAKN